MFAALEIATGQVAAVCKLRHRHQEFLIFLRDLARGHPDQQLHLIMDLYAAHKHPKVTAWLAANPDPYPLHPDIGILAEPVKVWFSIIERQAIHRGAAAHPTRSRNSPQLQKSEEVPFLYRSDFLGAHCAWHVSWVLLFAALL
jgi:hypothetical protein